MAENNTKECRFVFVGAGNLATHLATALADAGFSIAQVYSRTAESARLLSTRIGAEWTTDIDALLHDASCYFVCLKDDAFITLLPRIVKGRGKALFVHTAGSIPMDVWKESISRYGVFYPLQTFSKQREVDFSQIPVFLEASSEDELLTLKVLAQCISERVYEADSGKRRLLHLAAVFACNFTNHMYALANDVLKDSGLPFDALLPLIDETARKVHELPPGQAQTGPAVRYDEQIIQKHLDLLAGDSRMQKIYSVISESIHEENGTVSSRKPR